MNNLECFIPQRRYDYQLNTPNDVFQIFVLFLIFLSFQKSHSVNKFVLASVGRAIYNEFTQKTEPHDYLFYKIVYDIFVKRSTLIYNNMENKSEKNISGRSAYCTTPPFYWRISLKILFLLFVLSILCVIYSLKFIIGRQERHRITKILY